MDSHGHISVEEARQALREVYCSDTESNLKAILLQSFSDELRPTDQKGHYRTSPILVLSCLVSCAILGIFVYFSLGGRG